MKYLTVEAATSLKALEKDTDGLIYTDFWRDGVASLAARRIRKTDQLPSYSLHNYGMALDLDLPSVLKEKKISYESLLYLMKKRGWYCLRRDGRADLPWANHFEFLGEYGEKYLSKTTLDPTTWQRPAEMRIYEKHGPSFVIDTKAAQLLLAKVGLYRGKATGTVDPYTREAVMAFQRTWDLIEDGALSMSTCRMLVFSTCDIEWLPAG